MAATFIDNKSAVAELFQQALASAYPSQVDDFVIDVEKPKNPAQPGLEQRISTYLQTRGGEYTSVQELAAQLKVAAPVLNLTLGKMAKAAKVERHSDGRVRLTKKAA